MSATTGDEGLEGTIDIVIHDGLIGHRGWLNGIYVFWDIYQICSTELISAHDWDSCSPNL